jgi:hypothetical protein
MEHKALPEYPTQQGRASHGPFRARKPASFLDTMSLPRLVLLSVALGVGIGLAAALLGSDGRGKLMSYLGFSVFSSCNVKGNISFHSGEHIYHVPGQENYIDTIIDPLKGERYFCSEAEARGAGWRRAGI